MGASIRIYCDGACKNNPGKSGSGVAVYGVRETPVMFYGAYLANGTNNTAELAAFFQAMQVAKRLTGESNSVTIMSDSKYSIDCITNWAYGWKKRGWSKKGGPIKNLALIQKCHALYDSLKDDIFVSHIKGHAGHEGNELADRLAGMAIDKEQYQYAEYTDAVEVLLRK